MLDKNLVFYLEKNVIIRDKEIVNYQGD